MDDVNIRSDGNQTGWEYGSRLIQLHSYSSDEKNVEEVDSDSKIRPLWRTSLESADSRPHPPFWLEFRRYSEFSANNESTEVLLEIKRKAEKGMRLFPSEKKFLWYLKEECVINCPPFVKKEILEETLAVVLAKEETALSVLYSDNEEFEVVKEKATVVTKAAEDLNRWKDHLYLISSYPAMKELEKEIFRNDHLDKFVLVNGGIAALKRHAHPNVETYDYVLCKILVSFIVRLLRSVEACLTEFNFHMGPYLGGVIPSPRSLDSLLEPWTPDVMVYSKIPEVIDKGQPELMPSMSSEFQKAPQPQKTLPAPQVVLNNCKIKSAIRQASHYIWSHRVSRIGYVRTQRIGISGSDADVVAEALPKTIKYKYFSRVFRMSVSRHDSVTDIERDIKHKFAILPCLLFLDCVDEPINLHNLVIFQEEQRLGYRPKVQIVLTTRSQKAYEIMPVNLEIRMEDHLTLPRDVFCNNIGGKEALMFHSSALQAIAVRLIEECRDDLLAIVLLARALKNVTDVGVWEGALNELTLQLQPPSPLEGISEVMLSVLRFIWQHKDTTSKNCILYCAWHEKETMFQKSSLISDWMKDSSMLTQKEGEDIFEDLVSSFLLETVGKEEGSVRMREEIRVMLLNQFAYIKQEGSGFTETPMVEKWKYVREIHLMNNKLSELPENPNCLFLKKFFLQLNYNLTEIPGSFFESMPVLQELNLSNTSVKSLPQSISKLVALREFYLKGCPLLMELPREVKALRNLEVLDLEGTTVICLPEEIGELINLKCLRVSFYGYADQYKESKGIDSIIPRNTLPKLTQLKELSIDVDPEGEWWEDEVKAIMEELCYLRNLETLKFYLPTDELLQQFLQLKTLYGILIYKKLRNFRLIVGPNQRIVSRLPRDLEDEIEKLEKCRKCLKYFNGEGNTKEIVTLLKHAHTLILYRHWTMKQLNTNEEDELKFCLLVECNDMQTIVDNRRKPRMACVLGWLQYLGIHYMKNLESIWKGPCVGDSLSHLKVLTLHTCPKLTTIFTQEWLVNLEGLKEVIVEDCPKINSLVSLKGLYFKNYDFLPSLIKISLLDLPELVSISCGLRIAPKLERMVIYNCPKLESLSTEEMSSEHMVEITGERHWWDALKWPESEWTSGKPDRLDRVFVPLAIDEDLMDQLSTDVKSLQHLK